MTNKEHLKKLIHDIKTPMTTISGYSALLGKSLKEGKNSSREMAWAQTITEETSKINNILKEISKIVESIP